MELSFKKHGKIQYHGNKLTIGFKPSTVSLTIDAVHFNNKVKTASLIVGKYVNIMQMRSILQSVVLEKQKTCSD